MQSHHFYWCHYYGNLVFYQAVVKLGVTNSSVSLISPLQDETPWFTAIMQHKVLTSYFI